MNKKSYFYGAVVLACMLLNVVGQGIPSSIMGLFIPNIVETLGQSQTAVSAIVSISLLSGMATIGIVTKLYKKYSAKIVVLVLGIFAGLSYIGMGWVTTLPKMYVMAALIGAFGLGATALSAPMLITNWFEDKRSTAMGIAIAGAGIGPALLAPVVTRSIVGGGYKLGFTVLGVLVVGMIVLASLLIKDNPQKAGLEPYRNGGEATKDKKAAPVAKAVKYNYTLKEAVKSKVFLPFTVYVLLICITVQAILIQLPSYLVSVGFEVSQVGTIIAMYALIAGFGKILIGFTFDKIGFKKSNLVFFSAMVLAFFALDLTASVPQAIYLYVLLAGMGLGLGAVSVPIFVSDVFGSKNYASIYPIFMVLVALGAIIGALLSGAIIDFVGYTAMIRFVIVGVVIAYLAIQTTLKLSDQEHAKRCGELELETAQVN